MTGAAVGIVGKPAFGVTMGVALTIGGSLNLVLGSVTVSCIRVSV